MRRHHVIGFGGHMRPRRRADNPYRRSRQRTSWSKVADRIAWAVVIVAGVSALAWIGSTVAHQLATLWQ